MASQKTIAAKLGVEARAEAVRKEVAERYAVSHPSIPRHSARWIGRNKGAPFSRMMLKHTVPGAPGRPARLLLQHPTRGTFHLKQASETLLAVFFPSIPENLAAHMLGR